MNYDEILKNYKAKTCVMSVERLADGRYGNIRVEAGNEAHCEDILHITGYPFVPGCPYEMCFPQNKNFEDFCVRCAFGGQPMHSYINLYQMGLWLNLFMVPLESDKENVGYLIYTYDVSPRVDDEQMTDIDANLSQKILGTCVKFRGSTDFTKTIGEVVHDIREICEGEECCIVLLDKEEKKCVCLGESLKEGTSLKPVNDYLDSRFYEMACNWMNILQGSTCLIIKDKDDMNDLKLKDPIWYDSLRAASVETVLLFPLQFGDELIGYIWSLNYNVDNTVKLKEALELTTFIIASEVANHLLVKRMEILSSVDMLTGIKNRNIMNNRIDRVIAGKDVLKEPYAIVFADLNGLKRVNDTEGHTSGDDMIKEAASILQSVFFDSEVYRAGGDEFMVIATDITQEVVEERIADIRDRVSKSDNVSMAVGAAYSGEEKNILKAMRVADQRMYADKDAFYGEHPDLRYR